MAMAAKVTIVQVAEVVEPGNLDPESIVTPGIFVDRVVAIANPAHESELVKAGASLPMTKQRNQQSGERARRWRSAWRRTFPTARM